MKWKKMIKNVRKGNNQGKYEQKIQFINKS